MSVSSACTVVLAEEISRDILLHHWESLKQGELPAATELTLQPLEGSVITAIPDEESLTQVSTEPTDATPAPASTNATKLRLPFCTNDFGGRLAERGDTGVPELTQQFHQWLEQADGLLLFLAVDQLQDPKDAQERLLEVDALLARLLEKDSGGHAVCQPIAVLITKWDLVSDLSGSPEEERQKVLAFLRDHAGQIGQAVCQKIEGVGERVQVFPVSTFGGHVDGKPICPLKPFNLHEPLVWVLRQTDRYLYEKAQRQADKACQNPVWWNYTAAIRAYEKLIDGYGISRGPIYQDIQAQLAPLRAARRRRTRRVVGVCAALLLLATGYGSYHLDQSQFIDLKNRLEVPREPYSVLEDAVTRHLKSSPLSHAWTAVLGHKSQIEKAWTKYKHEYEQQMKDHLRELEQLRSSPAPQDQREQIKHYQRLVDRCQDFLSRYPDSPFEKQVRDWMDQAELERGGLVWPVEAEAAVARAEEVLARTSMDLPDLRKAVEQLQKLKDVAPQQSGPRAQEPIKVTLDRLERLLDDLNAEIARYKRFDEQYDRLIAELSGMQPEAEAKRLEQFLVEHPESDYPRRRLKLGELQRRLAKCHRQIDEKRWAEVQAQFEEFRKLCQTLADGTKLDSLQKAYDTFLDAAKKYLGGTAPTPQHTEEAAKLKTRALELLDGAEWKDVENFARKYDKDFESIADKAQKYLQGNDRIRVDQRKHAKQAEDQIRTALEARWSELYRAFYERATQLNRLGDLDEAESKGKEFQEQLRKHKAGLLKPFVPSGDAWQKRETQVGRWMDWSRNQLCVVSAPKVTLALDSTPVDKDRSLRVKVLFDGQPVAATMDGQWQPAGETPWFKGKKEITVELRSRDFRKQSGKLRLEVTIDNWFTYGDTSAPVEVAVPEDFFSADGRCRGFELPGWEGKKATVEFKCPELTPPPLDKPD